jgi:copper(I)-binding protein
MLQAHPDKTKDNGGKAREYNEAREIAKQFAENPKHQGRRVTMKNHDNAMEDLLRVNLSYRVKAFIHDMYMKNDPSRYYPAEFKRTAKEWTPQ